MPRVSICTSVLNQSEFLKGMIDSVMEQTFADWELILVDDGSTEDIKGIVDGYNDYRIKYHRFPENKGHIAGFNFAFQQVTAEYFQPLSADERLEKFKLSWQVEYLDQHPEKACIWGLPNGNKEFGFRPEWEQYALKAHNRSREAWVRTLANLDNIPLGGCSMLARSEVIKRVGLYDPQFIRCADLEWFIRFFKHYDAVVMPCRWAISVDNPGSLSNTAKQDEFLKEVMAVRKKHEVLPPISVGAVTCVMPVKNMEKWVGEAVRSVLNQTYPDMRVMVWNDGSTDGTLAALKAIGDERVQVFDNAESIGPEAAITQMIGRCETPFTMILSADDTVSPDMVTECMAKFQRDPWLEFVATLTDFIDADGAPFTGEHPFKSIARPSNKSRDQWLATLYHGNQYFGAGVYRTQALKDVGGLDSTVGCLGDYDLYLKLLQRENIHVVEMDLTHTRIHDGNRSALNAEARDRLKDDYHKIKSRYYVPRPKLIIATPFYEMKGYSPYIFSLVHTIKMLTTLGIDNEWWELSGDSYVDRAKNTIMNKFLDDPANTHLLMIDSDMHWNPDAVLKLLALPEEVVAGSYPQKNGWEKWTSTPLFHKDETDPNRLHPVGRVLEDGTALLLAEYLAGGFMMIKRSALEKFRTHHKDLIYYDSGADPGNPERLYTEFSACERGEYQGRRVRYGEDRVFGRRLAEAGVQCFIYPNIDFGHYGVKAWTGNFDKFLRGQKPAEDPAVQRI